MAKFLKNTKTGVVLNHSDIWAKRVDMVPCDVRGKIIVVTPATKLEAPKASSKKSKSPKGKLEGNTSEGNTSEGN